MAKKPPDWRQPSLFPLDPDDAPEPQDYATHQPNGDRYAVQNDSPRTLEGTDGVARTAPQGAQAPDDDGTLRQGAEGQPRSLEAAPLPDAAEERPDPDRQPGPGGGAVHAERRRPSHAGSRPAYLAVRCALAVYPSH